MISPMPHPMEETLVALDLETTGIDARTDRIIDVGAVKFRGDEEIARFATLVNPRTEIPPFVSNLTGISQSDVEFSPEFRQIATDVQDFIGSHRLVGHNIDFDIRFLRAQKVAVEGGTYDTMEMARIALPHGPEFGLERLGERFRLVHDAPHRALSDAIASKDLFLLMLERFAALPNQMLVRLSQLASDDAWSISDLARNLLDSRQVFEADPRLGVNGIDEDALGELLSLDGAPRYHAGADASGSEFSPDFVGRVDAVFAPGGLLAQSLPGFEVRDGQREMARMVASTLLEGSNAIVEAGTGIGKTLAYLIPAAMYSQESGNQVVVSTNTINLQEQLLKKDFNAVKSVMSSLSGQRLEAAQLKGRSNYLCYRRWSDAIGQRQSVPGIARILAQCMTWLPTTETGDSAEVALSFDTRHFREVSADGCPPSRGRPSYACQGPPCFMLKARANASNADVVIVNHSLLILDRVNETGIVPSDAALIIDEAHHLQATATDQMGFWVRESVLLADLDSVADPTGVMSRLANLAAAKSAGSAPLNPVPEWREQIVASARRARMHGRRLFSALERFTSEAMRRAGSREMRILPKTRIDPGWATVAKHWGEFAYELNQVIAGINRMLNAVVEDESSNDATVINASSLLESLTKSRFGLESAIESPDDNFVYWSSVDDRRDLDVEVRGAPLDVSEKLNEVLFSSGAPTVLTGATLSSQGDFTRFADQVGVGEREDMSLSSPFDFERSALIVVPEDIPAPNEPGYADAVARMLHGIGARTNGRTLALFTANSALNNAHRYLSPHFARGETNLLAQGRDGPAARVLRLLKQSERGFALGSMAMWEGIDLEEASIKSLVMTRLPFPVPTDPIHASRSERMDNPFMQYMVPEAVMKFRQGFGRLIRSHTDRGVFVVLDRRILTQRYASEFQKSIPRCTVRRVTLATLADYVERWHSNLEV